MGKATDTGAQVTQFKIGDRAGFGWIRDACRVCSHCLEGQENICAKGYTGLIVGHHGGFADRLRAPADFAYQIPDQLDSAHAALCYAQVFGQKKLVGSIVGGRHFMKEMLEMAAIHQILPLIETMPLSQINEAMDRVASNQARYRIVLTSD